MRCFAELRVGFPRQFSVLQLPFTHLIEGADAYIETLALRSFSCTMDCSGVGMRQVAGHLALLKTFPLDLGAVVENFTIESCGLQLIENLWLRQEFKQDSQGLEN